MFMKYDKKIMCPYCENEGTGYELLKEWDYTYLHVNYLICPKCKNKFRMNWGVKEDGIKVAYTIPRGKS